MKKIAIFIIVLIICACSFIGCNDNPNNDDPSMEPDVELYSSVYSMYKNYNNYSFAKLTVKSIDEDIYESIGVSSAFPPRYMLLECVVEEDFYGRLQNGAVIYLPVCLKYLNTFWDEQKVRDLFTGSEHILTYGWTDDNYFGIKNMNTGEILNEDNIRLFIIGPLPEFYVIPIRQNKVDFGALYDSIGKDERYSHDKYIDYTKYIDDGMTLEEVSENIKKLAIDSTLKE